MDFYGSRNPESLSRVIPRICISNVVTACNVKKLVDANIRFVLTCLDYNLPQDVLDEYKRAGIEQLYLPVNDFISECLIDTHYERVIGFLTRAEAACLLLDSLNAHVDCSTRECTRSADSLRKSVDVHSKSVDVHSKSASILVHCHMGMSRSVTCVAMYLLYKTSCQSRVHGHYAYERDMRVSLLNCNNVDEVECVLDFIKQGRPIARVNPGFHAQLYCLANNLRKACRLAAT